MFRTSHCQDIQDLDYTDFLNLLQFKARLHCDISKPGLAADVVGVPLGKGFILFLRYPPVVSLSLFYLSAVLLLYFSALFYFFTWSLFIYICRFKYCIILPLFSAWYLYLAYPVYFYWVYHGSNYILLSINSYSQRKLFWWQW